MWGGAKFSKNDNPRVPIYKLDGVKTGTLKGVLILSNERKKVIYK